ncbi:MAG: vitamin K epoxide reductase family protein [Byssovorax sp.]
MRKAVLVILLRLSLLAALFASVALLLEYQRAADPAFCGVGSGCMAVRMSPYSQLFGVPLPTWGLIAFGSLFGFAMTARDRMWHRIVAVISGLGALAAVYLVYLQAFEIRAFCKWCILADSGAFVAAISAGLLYAHVVKGGVARDKPTPNETSLAELLAVPQVSIAWVAAAVVAVGAPFLWAQYPVTPSLPPEIAALQVPGKVTIVSFTDFECPHCRALHPVIEEVVHQHPDQLVVVRKMVPLSSHPGAMPAALAYTCVPPTSREQMADALYRAPEELFNREGLLALAEAKVGMSRAELGRCMAAPETRAIVEADRALFTQLQGQGLPLTYVGSRVLLGFKANQLREAVGLALTGPRPSLPLAGLFALVGAALAAAAAITIRSQRTLCKSHESR